MMKLLIQEIEQATECNVITWDKSRYIKYIVKSPEEIEANCLCFYSENDQENSLLEKLAGCKASGVVVQKPCKLNIDKWKKAGVGIIEVSNMIMFQIGLAKIYRTKFDIPIVQVIGSAGKTTTKDMIGAILSYKMPALVGYANYNTAFGAASNILSLRDYHKAGVLEAGTQSKGYMGLTTNMIKPRIAVLTSIQRAHFVTFGSIEKIIEAKSEIFDFLDENGVFIYNGDDPNSSRFPVDRFRGRVLKYGFSDKNDLWATDITYKDFKTFFNIRGKGMQTECVINTVGEYNVANALAAFLVGLEFKMAPKDICRGLAEFEPMARRLKIIEGPYHTTLVDDNFNANPDSTKLLLKDIPKFAGNRPVMLVMGDVERPDDNIQKYAREVHLAIGHQIAEINFDKLIAIGKWAEEYVKGAVEKGVPPSKTAYFETVEQAEKYFKSSVIPESVIIFKASVYVQVRNLIKSLDI